MHFPKNYCAALTATQAWNQKGHRNQQAKAACRFRNYRGIGGRKLVPIPDVKVGHIRRTISVKVGLGPVACYGELGGVEEVKVCHIHHTVQIRIATEERVSASVVSIGSTTLRQPAFGRIIQINEVNEAITIEIEVGIVGTGDNFLRECINIGEITISIVVKVAWRSSCICLLYTSDAADE